MKSSINIEHPESIVILHVNKCTFLGLSFGGLDWDVNALRNRCLHNRRMGKFNIYDESNACL